MVQVFFSVHSFYEWLNFDGIINTDFDIVWQCKISDKVQIFMWFVRKRKILTKDQLLKRGWDDNSCCVFYGLYEKYRSPLS
jgi:zinc-binding in reverse transcriptase